MSLTLKETTDGLLWHARFLDDSYGNQTEDTEFILDEHDQLIPASVCLCSAREPSECCCATDSWGEAIYD